MSRDILFVGQRDDFELLTHIVALVTPKAALEFCDIEEGLAPAVKKVSQSSPGLVMTAWRRHGGNFDHPGQVYGLAIALTARTKQIPTLIYTNHPHARPVWGSELVNKLKTPIPDLIKTISRLLATSSE